MLQGKELILEQERVKLKLKRQEGLSEINDMIERIMKEIQQSPEKFNKEILEQIRGLFLRFNDAYNKLDFKLKSENTFKNLKKHNDELRIEVKGLYEICSEIDGFHKENQRISEMVIFGENLKNEIEESRKIQEQKKPGNTDNNTVLLNQVGRLIGSTVGMLAVTFKSYFSPDQDNKSLGRCKEIGSCGQKSLEH